MMRPVCDVASLRRFKRATIHLWLVDIDAAPWRVGLLGSFESTLMGSRGHLVAGERLISERACSRLQPARHQLGLTGRLCRKPHCDVDFGTGP
jgi:hypothetical protein